MLRLISRIRERDGILGFAQLVGIKYNQTIIGEVFAQLRRELLERAVVRDRPPTCAYHYKQMVVIHLPGQYQQIPQSSRREKSVKVCPYFFFTNACNCTVVSSFAKKCTGSPTYRPSGKNAPPTSESLLRIPPWEERLQ
mgnify:CR=1 FL=1